jgi:DNA helicase HerA-like ATPase
MTLEGLRIGKSTKDLVLLPKMANRHGLVTGATGTGKTVTLQVMAESFSRIGVPVFAADVKGDLAGVSQPGAASPKLQARIDKLGLGDHVFEGSPATLWDIFGQQGHPVRATVSDMGPLLLARLMNLSDVQSGVLTLIFKLADDHGLLLLDLKDLRAMTQFVGDRGGDFESEYGRMSTASLGAVQRGLVVLEEQGADRFFGEPALNLDDLMQTDGRGRGMINILAADKLMLTPRAYSTFLLWLLAELFERLPEVGDVEKPRLVFFFDEAHLLFTDAPRVLLEKIEQVVRLIRSKGVGVYFVTQNPLDVPDIVLGQLGNRVQHALRAFTPRDQKAVRAAAETFRQNPELDVETAITELGVGEALISFLDEKGHPGIVERAFVVPPRSRMGLITAPERQAIVQSSLVWGHYERAVDRHSAYEMLKARAEKEAAEQAARAAAPPAQPFPESPYGYPYPPPPAKGRTRAARSHPGYPSPAPKRTTARRRDTLAEAMAKSAARTVGSTLGRQIIRGVLGSIFGGRR